MGNKVKEGTKTSAFGVSKRENHDSSIFYSSKMYEGLNGEKNVKYIENEIDPDIINKIHCLDSRNISILPENSIHLMVTSPPYNASKEYDEDLSLKEYLQLLKDVFQEVFRVLVPGGRACVNIANLGRKPYLPLSSYIIRDMIDIGFLMRGEVIWDKGTPGGSCAWGSWQSAANPTLRDGHEYILIFSKDKYNRPSKGKENTISKEEFLDFTKSVWEFTPESAKKIGHPAPFPIELPYRCIQLFTFKNDVVLDPFVGSGTTCVAAIKTGRRFIGIDIDEEYVKNAHKRIKKYQDQMKLSYFEKL